MVGLLSLCGVSSYGMMQCGLICCGEYDMIYFREHTYDLAKVCLSMVGQVV
jgi:hypothetical protein